MPKEFTRTNPHGFESIGMIAYCQYVIVVHRWERYCHILLVQLTLWRSQSYANPDLTKFI